MTTYFYIIGYVLFDITLTLFCCFNFEFTTMLNYVNKDLVWPRAFQMSQPKAQQTYWHLIATTSVCAITILSVLYFSSLLST